MRYRSVSVPRPLNRSLSRFTSALAVAAALSFASESARAQSLFWDPGADGDSIIGGTGTWNLTNTFWDSSGLDLLADNVVWPNNNATVAVFGGTPGIVTLNNGGATMTANGLTFNTSGYILNSNAAGDTLTLAGTTPTVTVTNAGHFARVNSILAGTGFSTVGSGTLVLGGANTFTGPLNIGAGSTVAANTATALGATGVGNETIVASGGTLNIGGQNLGAERIRIAGAGVGGLGALINRGASRADVLNVQFITLDAHATVSASTEIGTSSLPSGAYNINTGRWDLRLGAYSAGAQNLNLGGNTLTKAGEGHMAIVNADVTAGNIAIDAGLISIEGGTVLNGTGTITVNQGGRLTFYSHTGAVNGWGITVNGGIVGDTLSTAASQTITMPVQITGANNPVFVSTANTTTMSGLISQTAFTGTEVMKRGGGTSALAFSNIANSFSVPVSVYQGTVRGHYQTALGAGGVGNVTPLSSTDTPLGTASTANIKGGALGIRLNLANDATQQRWALGKTVNIDLAPGTMDFDRLSNSSQTEKNLVADVVMAAPASANNFAIGQNQLTFSQLNTHRLEFSSLTMNNDTVLNSGDFTFNGNTTSSGQHSLVKIGGNSWGFIGGTHQFNGIFNIGGTSLRVGSMFGTAVTNNTVTAGTGTIYNGPNNAAAFRTPTNLAAGQVIDATVSQRLLNPVVNFEQFTSVAANLRAANSGVLGFGGATIPGTLDLSKIGDGTWRIGGNFSATGNANLNGQILPGAGNAVRLAAAGTTVVSGTDRISGTATLDIGSDLIDGTFRQQVNGAAQNGTVILTGGANNYTGGTNVNRGSTLRFQNQGSVGSGQMNVFGTATAEVAGGTFILPGGTTNLPVTLFGGSTLRFDSSTLTTTTNTDRWLDTAPIGLNAATLQLDARNNNSTTNETVGAISYAGGSTISLQRNNAGAAQIVQLQTPSLNRVGTGTLEVTRAGSSGFGSTVKLLTTTTTPTVTNGMVHPSLVTIDATRLQNFATFDANGINNSIYTNTVTTAAFPTGLSAGTQIVYVDFASGVLTSMLGDNPVIYALKVGQGNTAGTGTTIASGTGTSITLRSGGLIASGDGTSGNFSNATGNTTTIATGLVFNDGTSNIEALINVRGGTTATLSGVVTSAGLTKFGGGTLIMSNAANAITGNASVNQGVLELRAATAATVAPGGTANIRLHGGQLNVRGAAGGYTLTNGVTVAQGIPIATLNSDRSDSSSSGTVTFNPSVAGPGLVLEGSAGTQGQTLNITGANYGVTFGSNANNSFTGNVTINNSITTTFNNNPSILGTNPVFTKAGTGTLDIGITGGVPTVAAGAQVVLDEGTLQMRSINTFGATSQATLVLNRGTLNLRRNGASIFGATTGYPVIVNGNTAISADRVDTGGGSNALHQLGKLTLNPNVTLSISSGNTYAVGFTGAQLNGIAFLSSTIGPGDLNSAVRFLINNDVSGGALVKMGGGHLHFFNADSTYSGGTYINQGIVRLRAQNALGTGPVYLNPGGILDINAVTNMGASQPLFIRSTSAFPSMVSVNLNGVTHPTGASVDSSQATTTGIVGLSNGAALYNNPIDLGTLYGGRWSLGGISGGVYDPRYTAATLGAGADNLYRLGGGGTSMFISISDANGTPRNNVLTGGNSVRMGFDSGNLFPVALNNYQYVIGGTQDFTGSTVIHRGMVARLGSAAAGGRSGLSSGAIDVFGSLYLSSASTLQDGGTSTNAITLHPGSAIQLDNNNAAATNMPTANVTNRVADSQALALNGALIDLIGTNNAVSSESLGDSTWNRGARLHVRRTGTGTATLTFNSLAPADSTGNSLLLHTAAAGTLGAAANGDRILITTGAPTPVNDMVSSAIVNATDNTFVTYGATNGFANVTYDKTITTGTYTAGSLLPTDLVDIATTDVALTDNPSVWALRTARTINIGGPFNQITIGSGGLIMTAGITLQPNLVFNDASSNVEARIYTSANATINGLITAAGVVKSGNGQLIIGTAQPSYAGGWTVNSGDLIFNDPQGPGQSVPGNGITLNATQVTGAGGLNPSTMTATRVVFQRDNGTPELVTFTGGPITAVNDVTITTSANNDRNMAIPAVALESTGAGARAALTWDVRSNRFRATTPTMTLNSDALLRVWDATLTGANDTGKWTSATVGSLVGTSRNLTKIGNRTLELSGDNSATFIGGSITVGQGTLRVTNNNALGSATTTTTIERNAALEIGVSNFNPVGLTQNAGSIERWNVEDARPGTTYNLPAGVNLQLNTNLLAARTIGLNGGSLEGFLYADHVAAADQRLVGSAVTVNLLADSFVGQNVLLGQNYEAGRQPTIGQPYGETFNGSFLRIDGNITGAFNLTKTGFDVVTLAGTGNTYNNTIVEAGALRIAATNALPTGGTLTTKLSGIFDLYGHDQTVAGLGTVTAAPNQVGVAVGSSGRILNSAPNDNTLRVNASGNFTYNGTIEQNVALTKDGTGNLLLAGANTYRGDTVIEEGTLLLSGSISGTKNIDVQAGATFDVTGVAGGYTLLSTQTLKGNGSVNGSVDIDGTISPGASPGTLTLTGSADFDTGSTFALEIDSDSSFDKLVANGVTLDGTVNLTIALNYTPAAFTSYLVLDNTSASPIGGTTGFFTWIGPEGVLTEGESFFVGPQEFSITYAGGTGGNDVVLVAVPEPSTVLSLLTGVALLGLRRRRSVSPRR